MTRNELLEGIAVILVQATLPDLWAKTGCAPDPDDAKACANWVDIVSVYLYEFSIRFKQKGLKYERAMELAEKATHKRVNKEAYERIMALPLPWEVQDASKSGELPNSIRLRPDGTRYCPYCGRDSGGERRASGGGREEGSA